MAEQTPVVDQSVPRVRRRGGHDEPVAPRADDRWTAPDLARARALVRASGTRVALWDVSDDGSPEPIARYLTGILRRLGYRVAARRRVQVLPKQQPGGHR
jgi:hypothetical protein